MHLFNLLMFWKYTNVSEIIIRNRVTQYTTSSQLAMSQVDNEDTRVVEADVSNDELAKSVGELKLGNEGHDDEEIAEFQECNEGFSYEKDLQKAMAAKEEGNEFFRKKEYDEALEHYSRAVTFCPEDDKENLATFYGNRSAAYFALEEWDLVVEDCTSAIELKPDYVKVLARRMLANEKLEKIEDALRGTYCTLLSCYNRTCVCLSMFLAHSFPRIGVPQTQN
jgi:tetratricopeptide (TPR) repeat protein